MDESETIFWREVALEIIAKVEKAISPLIGKKESGEVIKMGADGTPSKLIDLVAEKEVISILEKISYPILLISEEIGELEIGCESTDKSYIKDTDSKIVFVVDPLDGTSNAVKNIPAYGISLAVAKYPFKKRAPQLKDVKMGFVKNFATGDFFEGLKGKGANLNGEKIQGSDLIDVNNSSMGLFIYGTTFNQIDHLFQQIRRMRILGSVSIELCYVANGSYDAFVDINENLRVIDIAASQLIITESGGKISTQQGKPINKVLNAKERTSIVAAGNEKLHEKLIEIMEVI